MGGPPTGGVEPPPARRGAASVAADNAQTVSAALNLALQDVLGQLVNWTLAAI